MKSFEDKVVVVTGGAHGIGATIANMALYLASGKAGFITGENICIDGGMTRQMIYHNDCGWKFEG
jgi:NAD(P)-dependent dehydrogenase (short-subunit alcohol dehydrogenase family)